MSEGFKLLMISAMYENGGNTTQRFLDGHPELHQLSFRVAARHASRERPPVGSLSRQVSVAGLSSRRNRRPGLRARHRRGVQGPDQDPASRASSATFRWRSTTRSERSSSWPSIEKGQRTRAALVDAFFKATAEAWKDRARFASERVYVGYSPIVGVDADRILVDFPEAHVVNVVRNPWSAYADTKKRPVPLSLAHYMTGWCVHQLAALVSSARFPGRAHVLRYEDIVADPKGALSPVLAGLGVGGSPALERPSWNGKPLAEVYPWGTIRVPTPAANAATARELPREEADEIQQRTGPLLAAFRYERP